jgi:hypothetical protein
VEHTIEQLKTAPGCAAPSDVSRLLEMNEALKDDLIHNLVIICELQKASERMIAACGPCTYHDHHGNCQSHFIGNPCVVEELRTAVQKSRQ